MSNYKKMYFQLFNEITDVIENLKTIQQKAEEYYLEQDENNIVEVTTTKKLNE